MKSDWNLVRGVASSAAEAEKFAKKGARRRRRPQRL